MNEINRFSVNFYADNLIQPCIEAAAEVNVGLTLNFINKGRDPEFVMQTTIAKEYINNANVPIEMCAYVGNYKEAILATTTPCNEVSVKNGELNEEEIKDVIKIYHAINRKVQVECDDVASAAKYTELGADKIEVPCDLVEEVSKINKTVTSLNDETVDEAKKMFAKNVSTILLDKSLNVEATKTMRTQKEVNPYSIKVIEEYFRGYKEQIKTFLKEAK